MKEKDRASRGAERAPNGCKASRTGERSPPLLSLRARKQVRAAGGRYPAA